MILTMVGIVGIANGLDAVKQKKIDACIKVADDKYHKAWESTCEKLELGADCKLPIEVGKVYIEYIQNEREFCLERNR